jgi:hypothetical protein
MSLAALSKGHVGLDSIQRLLAHQHPVSCIPCTGFLWHPGVRYAPPRCLADVPVHHRLPHASWPAPEPRSALNRECCAQVRARCALSRLRVGPVIPSVSRACAVYTQRGSTGPVRRRRIATPQRRVMPPRRRQLAYKPNMPSVHLPTWPFPAFHGSPFTQMSCVPSRCGSPLSAADSDLHPCKIAA